MNFLYIETVDFCSATHTADSVSQELIEWETLFVTFEFDMALTSGIWEDSNPN